MNDFSPVFNVFKPLPLDKRPATPPSFVAAASAAGFHPAAIGTVNGERAIQGWFDDVPGIFAAVTVEGGSKQCAERLAKLKARLMAIYPGKVVKAVPAQLPVPEKIESNAAAEVALPVGKAVATAAEVATAPVKSYRSAPRRRLYEWVVAPGPQDEYVSVLAQDARGHKLPNHVIAMRLGMASDQPQRNGAADAQKWLYVSGLDAEDAKRTAERIYGPCPALPKPEIAQAVKTETCAKAKSLTIIHDENPSRVLFHGIVFKRKKRHGAPGRTPHYEKRRRLALG